MFTKLLKLVALIALTLVLGGAVWGQMVNQERDWQILQERLNQSTSL